jgi:hypothetical protein
VAEEVELTERNEHDLENLRNNGSHVGLIISYADSVYRITHKDVEYLATEDFTQAKAYVDGYWAALNGNERAVANLKVQLLGWSPRIRAKLKKLGYDPEGTLKLNQEDLQQLIFKVLGSTVFKKRLNIRIVHKTAHFYRIDVDDQHFQQR